ncbi:MAG TPA: methyltransferase [Gemmatimonadaceae bacterium]|jgi:methylase of polypeptide subunit release factors
MTSVSSSSTQSPLAGAASDADYPLRFASRETFAAVRELFKRTQFDEAVVAARFGRATLFDFARLCDGRKTLGGEVDDANGALVRLLLDGEPLSAARADELCGASDISALRAIGVLTADPADASMLVATVLLSPTQGVWVAQDIPPRRHGEVSAAEASMTRDVVFPAVTDLTGQFVRTLAFEPGTRALELCAGTGVAALMAVHHGAAEGWTTDITERSVYFERWNAALNGFDNVHAVRSDAWDGLDGETFDRIYAHPPYIATLTHLYDYRDAGEDGEHVSRRIVQGLPAHLRPGGRATITCALTDRVDAPIEKRIREWLGDDSDDFDLVLFQRREWDAMHAFRSATRQKDSFKGAEAWLEHFRRLGIERFVLCSFELRRDPLERAPITVRRRAGANLDAAAIDFVYRWTFYVAAGRSPESRLAGQRPRLVPGAQLRTAWRVDADREWNIAGSTVATDYPVVAAIDVPPGVPKLLELCDGSRDVVALHKELQDAGEVSNEVTVANVAGLVELLASIGALELPACPLAR